LLFSVPARAVEKHKMSAPTDWKITPVVGMNFTTTTETDATQTDLQTQDITQSMGVGFSLGILAQATFFPRWEFESGLLYAHQRVNESFNDTNDEIVGSLYTTFNYLQIPVVARYEFFPFFSAGGGIYYDKGLGSTVTNIAIPNTNTSSVTAPFSKTGSAHGDFGLIFNARGTYPIIPGITAIGDLRYLVGLVDISDDGNPDDVAHIRELQLLAGVSFNL
jgi:hypothetical protein